MGILYFNQKKKVLDHLGTGDMLMFLFLCFCFSVVSFFILFVFSLVFSLVLHLVLKTKYPRHQSVPLAGYMSVYFSAVYAISLIMHYNSIFIN
ncbi:hypothetical protein HYN49_04925 [Flavobacterium pallidum]|uniref:Prepilin type IV endopeptidase peptidase domain-containing protein n=1 Tax=Flavobacterium pallidum TaxID=2172098 RepID=A0A2S1SFV8_9FLAO|nr:hypothetical protein HYN49_04925 [Flavobacterium pallidum]